MAIAIVDYGSGNLHSVAKAFERAVRETGHNTSVLVTSSANDILAADRIVLPGVGAFADCAAGLRALPGMVDALEVRVRKEGVPFLGICVGMQLLATEGLEHGKTAGLNWIPGRVDKINTGDQELKIPHMGWNILNIHHLHPLLEDFHTEESTGTHVYFVHSYHFQLENPDHLIATADYGIQLGAMIGKDNIVGVQFHPEKSQRAGLKLISNFLHWNP